MIDGKDEMTVDKAIKICREKSKNIKLKVDPDVFANIAEWLEELKRLRLEPVTTNISKMARAYNNGYNKALDDLMTKLDCDKYLLNEWQRDVIRDKVKEIREASGD